MKNQDSKQEPSNKKFLYRNRTNIFLWFIFSFLGIVISGLFGFGIHHLSTFAQGNWLNSPGPWTFLIVLAGAPTGWFVWFVRDQNRSRELENKEFDLKNEEIKLKNTKIELEQKKVEHDWEIFRQLEEWATIGGNVALCSAAILHLRQFIARDSDEGISWSVLVRKNPFSWPGQLLLKALLITRNWESHGKDVRFALRSPIEQAITTTIRALDRESHIKTLNFAGWNLSNLVLDHAQWMYAKLGSTNLKEAVLTNADLRGSDLRKANLSSANLTNAKLQLADLGGADLSNADLTAADLTKAKFGHFDFDLQEDIGVNMSGAILAGADLTGVDLSMATLDGSFIDGARIELRWQNKVESAIGTEGFPNYVENE